MRWVDRPDPGSCESEISRQSRRPVERASCESERGRGISFAVSTRPVRAFGVVLFFLIVDCGYPLFWYPTPVDPDDDGGSAGVAGEGHQHGHACRLQ
jgi:hypothetical protein